MARRFNRGFAPRRQGPRRMTEWGASADQNTIIGIGPNVILLNQSLSQATLAGVVPATVVRVRGELYTRSDQSAANESAFGAMGFAVVTESARVAGVGSLPSPITDETDDIWFVYQTWLAGNSGPSTGALFGQPWYRQTFESKAMRKLQDGEAIVVMMENADGAGQADFIIKFRLLFKLH